jgi:hypothetical protein
MSNIPEKALKYLEDKERPTGVKSSVRYGDFTRFNIADNQAELAKSNKVDIEKIMDYTNEFLSLLHMTNIECPKQKVESCRYRYSKLKKEIMTKYNLDNDSIKDIVWMKFTKDDVLGVVAASFDINFSYNNTSGIIINHLKKEWDESKVLIFPLQNIPLGLIKGDIERGIGNYLQDKKVPILDFYSHKY